MYSLTSDEIAQALADAKKRGVLVRIIRDLSQTSEKGDQDTLLEEAHIDVHILKGLGRGIMHDKFAIFDGLEGFTGSYNWTNNAENDNYENAFFFTDPAILQEYERQFQKLWETPQAGEARRRAAPGPSVIRRYPALSGVAIFLILLALAAALST